MAITARRNQRSAMGRARSVPRHRRLKTLLDGSRRLVVPLADLLATVGGYIAAHLIRFDGDIPARDLGFLSEGLPFLVAIRLACFAGFGLYRGVWTHASVRDLVAVFKGVTAGSVVFGVTLIFLGLRGHSRAILIIDWLLVV